MVLSCAVAAGTDASAPVVGIDLKGNLLLLFGNRGSFQFLIWPVVGLGVFMKLHMILIIGFALSVTGCAEKEQAALEQRDETQMAAPAAEPPTAEAPVAEKQSWRTDAFLQHMHAHAKQLDDLNFALADGDLEAAKTPAYWLSRHETVRVVQPEWQPYLDGMRGAARAVEDATDLPTARTAAERITEHCQGCHAAVGVDSE